jgi:hypothetical protein
MQPFIDAEIHKAVTDEVQAINGILFQANTVVEEGRLSG